MARALAQAGASVAISGRNLEKAAVRAAELQREGHAAAGFGFDATDQEATRAAAEQAADAFGAPVSILVNAAGGNSPDATAIAPERTFFDLSPRALREVFDANLMAGCLAPTQAIGKAMADSGLSCSIINITSVAAIQPLTRVLGYAAAKAAVENATRWLAVHFAKELRAPIRVNAIMPGFFLTEQNRFLLTIEDGGLSPRGRLIVDNTPMGRFGEPDELGGAVVYLASESSRFVTGSILAVDGGFTAFSGV
jgi:NAD(P)-dependent dehydrogenase (short-subunit alcohol dehydrogenase family)